MRRIVLLAVNDLKLTLRDRASFLWMLVLPVALMWFFGNFGGRGDPKIRLTVVDEDGAWLARAFIAELASPRIDLVEIAPEAAASTQGKVRTLTLARGFTDAVLRGEPQRLEVVPDEGASEEFSMAAEAHVLRAIARTLVQLVVMNQANGLRGEDPAREFAVLSARPPLVSLHVSTAGHGMPVPSGRAQSVPGILTMTVLMMTVIYGGVFLTLEKRDGTLRRQMAGPVSRQGVVFGKILGRLMIAAMQIAVLLAAGRLLLGVSLGGSPAGLALLLAAYAFCAAGLATLLGAILRSPEQASAIGWLTTMVMAALGGCWWPSEVVPRWLWTASHVFPTAWAMDAFHALISFGRGVDSVWLPALAIAGFGVLFSAAGARYLTSTAT